MPHFDIDVLRTATCIKTITVQADSRLEAQQKAIDQAGDYLYSERDAAYSLDMDSPQHVDEFSDLRASQLVLTCSCSNENVAYPSYVVVQVTPALIRSIKSATELCRKEGLLSVTLAIQSTSDWAPVNGYGSFDNDMGLGKVQITEDDFCISAGMRFSDAVVESVNVPFNDLMQHILDRVPETVFFDGEDADEQALREQLAEDRAMAIGSAPASEQPQG